MKTLISTLALIIFIGAGCTNNSYTVDVSPVTKGNVPTVNSGIPFPNWSTIINGVDLKQVTVDTNSTTELFTIVRFDTTAHSLQVAIDTAHPKTITQWQEQLQAAVVINGNYFDEKYTPTTKVIVAGKGYGPYLSGQTAMIHTTNQTTPQQWIFGKANKAVLDQAWFGLQSYPLLLQESKVVFTAGSDDVAQRTVVAQDDAGHMYFITTEYGLLALNQLANVLATQLNLSLTAALNLDGGTSTGIAIQSEMVTYKEDSAPVPVVLYIQ